MESVEKEGISIHGGLVSRGPVCGRVAGTKGVNILVSVDGAEPVAARLLSSVDRSLLMKPESVGREVLLTFIGNDSACPVIMGVMENVLDELVEMGVESMPKSSKPTEVRVDGKRVVIEAEQELELKCGKSSITLKKNGKILIKGSELLSRASGANRIKGGSVALN